MSKPIRNLLVAASLLAGCGRAHADRDRLTRRFDAGGMTRVILRAAGADAAVVEPTAGDDPIAVAGRVTGGAEGYHPADPAWRETTAADWGLDFVARRFGTTLVISSRNEIGYIHHHYVVADIVVQLPPAVTLVRQKRTLSGSGEADLGSP